MAPPRRRPQFNPDFIDQQLQQIHLLDPASSSENLEQLGPIIRQIHINRQQEAYLRAVQGLIDSKDAEIEKICSENYQEFISSVSTLFTVKSYTNNLREKITSLDASVSQVGKSLVQKKRAHLQSKKTSTNLDEAIDTLQACLRVLDVVNRVGEMVREGKYWSALRSLEDIQNLPPTSLSHTPFFQHLLSSIPSLRGQIKEAVAASIKQWLLEVRNMSKDVGDLALEYMDHRARRWRARREKDPMLRANKVGSAVELVTHEKTEHDPLNNDRLVVDFKRLYECIQIYTALDSLDELRKSYQADRMKQAELVISIPLNLSTLADTTANITGFFIIENHVLNTTGNFRSELEKEELWDAVVTRLCLALDYALKSQTTPDTFLQVKKNLIDFTATIEAYQYITTSLHAFVMQLFEKYVSFLEQQSGQRFDSVVSQDDNTNMYVETASELDAVLAIVWIANEERQTLVKSPLPMNLPWSRGFYLCCQDIRSFIQRFYQFVEGVSQQQHRRNIDDLLNKSLDKLLSARVGDGVAKRLASTSTLSQIAQIIVNLEHLQVACDELARSLTNLRSAQRGGVIKLTSASSSFSTTLTKALARLTSIINSKLDDFFDLSEYDWTPATRETESSMYLYELVNWLTTNVDGLALEERYKDEAYKGAVGYIAECFMDFITGRDIPMLNENAILNLLLDVDFLEEQFTSQGRAHLMTFFAELRTTTSIVFKDALQDYLNPTTRGSMYGVVRPKRLQALLEKLAKYGGSVRDTASRQRGEKWRKEAEAVGRLYPGS